MMTPTDGEVTTTSGGQRGVWISLDDDVLVLEAALGGGSGTSGSMMRKFGRGEVMMGARTGAVGPERDARTARMTVQLLGSGD